MLILFIGFELKLRKPSLTKKLQELDFSRVHILINTVFRTSRFTDTYVDGSIGRRRKHDRIRSTNNQNLFIHLIIIF